MSGTPRFAEMRDGAVACGQDVGGGRFVELWDAGARLAGRGTKGMVSALAAGWRADIVGCVSDHRRVGGSRYPLSRTDICCEGHGTAPCVFTEDADDEPGDLCGIGERSRREDWLVRFGPPPVVVWRWYE